jgi:hypothetical protein
VDSEEPRHPLRLPFITSLLVFGQGVPAHCGPDETCTDPYADFLPDYASSVERGTRAMVIVREGTAKEGQRYIEPLLVLSGKEYFAAPFDALQERVCDALRGKRPRFIAEVGLPAGGMRVIFDDGSAIVVPATEEPKE